MSDLLIWYDYDNAVRQPKFGRGRLDLPNVAHRDIGVDSQRS